MEKSPAESFKVRVTDAGTLIELVLVVLPDSFIFYPTSGGPMRPLRFVPFFDLNVACKSHKALTIENDGGLFAFSFYCQNEIDHKTHEEDFNYQWLAIAFEITKELIKSPRLEHFSGSIDIEDARLEFFEYHARRDAEEDDEEEEESSSV